MNAPALPYMGVTLSARPACSVGPPAFRSPGRGPRAQSEVRNSPGGSSRVAPHRCFASNGLSPHLAYLRLHRCGTEPADGGAVPIVKKNEIISPCRPPQARLPQRRLLTRSSTSTSISRYWSPSYLASCWVVSARARRALKPLGDAFVALIKMLIAPIIFFSVVLGMANMGEMGKVGRIGVKAIIYFEVVTTLALVLGLVVATWAARRRHEHHVAALDTTAIADYRRRPANGRRRFLLDIIPRRSSAPSPRQPAAGAARRLAVRLRPDQRSASAASRCWGIDRLGHIFFERRRHPREGRPDRRLRRDGLHRRQVRRRLAAVAR